MVLKIGHKSEFAQGSHSCDFRTEVLERDREHAFENLSQKKICTRGCVVRKFRTRGMGGANFAMSWLFSLVFPCFYLDFILQAFLPTC